MTLKIEDVDDNDRRELIQWLDLQRTAHRPVNEFLEAAVDALNRENGILQEAQPSLWEVV